MRDDPDSEDILTWILRAVCDANPGIAASKSNAILEVEQLTRRTLGGQRFYIAKKGVGVLPRGGRRER